MVEVQTPMGATLITKQATIIVTTKSPNPPDLIRRPIASLATERAGVATRDPRATS
jgi:hypothetical protein